MPNTHASEIRADLKRLSRDTDSGRSKAQPEMTHVRPLSGTLARRATAVAIAAVGLMSLLGALLGLNVHRWRDALLGTATSQPIDSVAVLPFENASADPDTEYLSDGISQSIINSLSQLRNLKVISRTSSFRFKGKQVSMLAVAQQLGVRAVVMGRVMQRGDALSISAELVDAEQDRELWGDQYHRKLADIFAMQAEIASEISQKLRLQLSGEDVSRLNKRYTESLEAYDLYLKAIDFGLAGDYQKSIDYCQRAIDKDPAFALAYAGLAELYNGLGEMGALPYSEAFSKAKTAALRALEIDDTLAEARAELAYAEMSLDWDFAGAERGYQQAIELNPSSARAHEAYSYYLAHVGHAEESIAEAKRALALDPLPTERLFNLAFAYYFAGQYDDALKEVRKALEVAPDPKSPNFYAAVIYVEKGMYEQAITEFQKMGDYPFALGHMGNAYARAHRVAEAQESIRKIKKHIAKDNIGNYEVALVYSGLGDEDRAFEWLERAFKVRDKGLTFLEVDPCLAPLRSDPRFQDLVERVGLPM